MNSKIVLIALIALTVLIAGCIDKDINPLKTKDDTKDQGMLKYFVYDKTIKPCEAPKTSKPENLKPYEDQLKEISFQYPTTWEYKPVYGGAVFRVTKKDESFSRFEASNIADSALFKSKNKLTVETNLQTETAFRINKRLKEDSGVDEKDLEVCSTTLDGNPAVKLTYKGYIGIDAEKANEIDSIKRMDILTVKNGTAYLASFELTEKKGKNLFEKYLPEVNYVMSTLKIIKE